MKARRKRDDIFKVLKGKECQLSISYLKGKGEIKDFQDKQNIVLIAIGPPLQEILNVVLKVESK